MKKSMTPASGTGMARLHGDEDAAVMVSFILTLPILWTVLAIYVQLALICTAVLYVQHATWVAGRSAVTALAEDDPDRVRRAAWTALAPLSPRSVQTSTDGEQVAQALQEARWSHAAAFAQRYAYAAATQVRWTGGLEHFSDQDGGEMDVTVRYRFQLTVPVAAGILAPITTTAGIRGRFMDIERTIRIERTPGRLCGSSLAGMVQRMFDQ